MSAEIIQFSTAARPARKRHVSYAAIIDAVDRVLERRLERPLPPPLTETAKNARIRIKRRDAWWHAGYLTNFWRARLDWQSALETAQRWEIADSASIPLVGSRFDLIDKWREAVVKQLITPAPDLAAITWKRAKLAGRGFSHLPITRERVERAIADDVAFLAAHPTRTKKGDQHEAPAPIAPEA